MDGFVVLVAGFVVLAAGLAVDDVLTGALPPR